MLRRRPHGASVRVDHPSLNSIAFDVEGWALTHSGDDNTPRCWQTPDGDGIGVSVTWGAEAFPPGMHSLAELRKHWDSRLRRMGGAVVEVAMNIVAGGPVYTIEYKMPQDPHGFCYSATILVPFDGFGFMIALHCEEKGTTGLREAIALDRKLHAGITNVEQIQQLVDALDSDHEVTDEEMPDHPLSRLHRLLSRITRSLAIAEPLRGLPRPAPLPAH